MGPGNPGSARRTGREIQIVPAGVDTTRFLPLPSGRPADSVFRFLCVGKWEERKGSAGLVRAFAEEFDPAEPVELVLHCGTAWRRERDFRQEIANQIAAVGRGNPRIVTSDPVEASRFVALMQRCHAFVLPTRAEAWGLPILEAMACELPCIVTDYSGLKEYANEDNCFLVRVQALVKAQVPEFYWPPHYDWGQWAEPDWKHLRALMRSVYENGEAARAKARRARHDAERLWTWDLAARKAIAHIREIRAGAAGRQCVRGVSTKWAGFLHGEPRLGVRSQQLPPCTFRRQGGSCCDRTPRRLRHNHFHDSGVAEPHGVRWSHQNLHSSGDHTPATRQRLSFYIF